MKQWIGFASLLFALTACSGAGDNRTDSKVDPATQQQPPENGSNPNIPQNNALDTSSGMVQDSSTQITYDSSAKAKHN